MKLTKKLLPALGMLALSASMLVTSTFAWFSMNTNVVANGMTVKAVGDQVFLQIGNKGEAFDDKNESYLSATADTVVTGDGLTPAAVISKVQGTFPTAGIPAADISDYTYTGGAWSWVTNVSDEVNDHAASGAYKEANSAAYWLLNEFDIRLDSDAGLDTAFAPLKVSGITSNIGATDLLGSCINVLVVGETTTDTDGNVTAAFTQLFTQTSAGTFVEVNATSNGKLTAGDFSYADDNPLTVKVYVYFDGEDSNCKTSVLKQDTSLNNYILNVSFTVGTTSQSS